MYNKEEIKQQSKNKKSNHLWQKWKDYKNWTFKKQDPKKLKDQIFADS